MKTTKLSRALILARIESMFGKGPNYTRFEEATAGQSELSLEDGFNLYRSLRVNVGNGVVLLPARFSSMPFPVQVMRNASKP